MFYCVPVIYVSLSDCVVFWVNTDSKFLGADKIAELITEKAFQNKSCNNALSLVKCAATGREKSRNYLRKC